MAIHPPAQIGIVQTLEEKEESSNEISNPLEVASAPDAPTDILMELAEHANPGVRRTLAANPNTPQAYLKSLWVTFPESFLINPIVDLWALTDPELLNEYSEKIAASLYHHLARRNRWSEIEEHISIKAREELTLIGKGSLGFWLAMDPSAEVRHKLAEYTEKEQVQGLLAVDESEKVRLALAKSHSLCTETHRVMASDPSHKVQFALAKNRRLTSHQNKNYQVEAGYQILALSDNAAVRSAVADCDQLDFDTLDRLANEKNWRIREAVARNSQTHQSTVERLAKDTSIKVRCAVAFLANISGDSIRSLEPEKHVQVRRALAGNPNTPDELLISYLQDSCVEVREAVRSIRNHNSYFIHAAANSPSIIVRGHIADKAGIPAKVLQELAHDSSLYVRHRIVSRLQCPRFQHDTINYRKLVDILSHDPHPFIRKAIVSDFRISKTRHAEMVSDPDARVRRALAQKSRLGIELYSQLTQDENGDVRKDAMLNLLAYGYRWGQHNSPNHFTSRFTDSRKIKAMTRILEPLTKDPEESIRVVLASNNNTPAAVLELLVSDESEDVQIALRRRSSFPRDELIQAACRRKDVLGLGKSNTIILTRQSIKYHATHPNVFIRGMVARNCSCTVKLLKRLTKDSSTFVRIKVAENPATPCPLLTDLSKDECEDVRETAIDRLEYRQKQRAKR